MAELSKIAELLNVNVEKIQLPADLQKPQGKKRRPWLQEDQSSNITTEEDETVTNFSEANKINREQLGDKRVTKGQQLDNNKIAKGQQLDNQTDSCDRTNKITKEQQLDNNKITKEQQLDNNKITNKEIYREKDRDENVVKVALKKLCGIQKKILDHIVNNCISNGSLVSGIMTNESLRAITSSSTGAVKTSIYRLVEKDLIIRKRGKQGRGGYYEFEITETLKNLAIKDRHQLLVNSRMDNNRITIREQMDNNRITIREQMDNYEDNNRVTEVFSSSGFNNYLNTTTTGEGKNESFVGLDEEWSKIDFEPLAKISFTETHLKQIASQGLLRPDMVQDSIHAFAFDLDNNEKGKSIRQPLNYFMGILRKGQPYAPPDNYEHPKARLMRLYAEKMKRIAKEREAVQKEAEELAFSEWLYKLTDDEIKKLLPGNINIAADRAIKDSPMARGVARNYFKENVWTNLKETIENSEE